MLFQAHSWAHTDRPQNAGDLLARNQRRVASGCDKTCSVEHFPKKLYLSISPSLCAISPSLCACLLARRLADPTVRELGRHDDLGLRRASDEGKASCGNRVARPEKGCQCPFPSSQPRPLSSSSANAARARSASTLENSLALSRAASRPLAARRQATSAPPKMAPIAARRLVSSAAATTFSGAAAARGARTCAGERPRGFKRPIHYMGSCSLRWVHWATRAEARFGAALGA